MVMEFFPKLLDRAESDGRAAKIDEHFGAMVRPVGRRSARDHRLHRFRRPVSFPNLMLDFTPSVEIGWRLARDCWGKGYATEAALAVLSFGFRQLGDFEEIVSFTVPANRRLRRVMERIGMTRSPADDFDHPAISEAHPLRRHVLYRATRPQRGLGRSPAGPKKGDFCNNSWVIRGELGRRPLIALPIFRAPVPRQTDWALD